MSASLSMFKKCEPLPDNLPRPSIPRGSVPPRQLKLLPFPHQEGIALDRRPTFHSALRSESQGHMSPLRIAHPVDGCRVILPNF